MTQKIMKNGVRILRPKELKKLMNAIPRPIDLLKFETALYTGARYTELQQIPKHPEFFYKDHIRMVTKKKKAINQERYIHLNPDGSRALRMLLKTKKNSYPTRCGWHKNLKRWADYAGLDPTGICAKSTRKTWESYLVTSYPKSLELVFLSQGHSQMTSLKFYLMIPFTEEEKKEIKEITAGWIIE